MKLTEIWQLSRAVTSPLPHRIINRILGLRHQFICSLILVTLMGLAPIQADTLAWEASHKSQTRQQAIAPRDAGAIDRLQPVERISLEPAYLYTREPKSIATEPVLHTVTTTRRDMMAVPEHSEAPGELPESGSAPPFCQMPSHAKKTASAEWAPLVCDAFERSEWETALCVMSYESEGHPQKTYAEKTGNDISVGLFQINHDNLAGENRIEAFENVSIIQTVDKDWIIEEGVEDPPYINTPTAIEILKVPKINVRLAARIHEEHGWLPAWKAQQSKKRCSLSSRAVTVAEGADAAQDGTTAGEVVR